MGDDGQPKMPAAIAEAIVQVKSAIAQLGFDERNAHGQYRYASVDKFYTAVRPLEANAGLFVMLDETACDVRESTRTDDRGQTKVTAWAFINYDVWLASVAGEVWGPLRRHWAGPVTGPQTFGTAESYVRKALARGLYMVPTGEKDGDELAARDDAPAAKLSSPAPTTRGVTRTAAPKKQEPAAAAEAVNGRPKWIEKFLAGETYEIDKDKAGGWSAWEKFYLTVCDYATDIDQITKLENDNGKYFSGFREAVREEVYRNFRNRVEDAEKRLWREPDTSIVNEMSGGA